MRILRCGDEALLAEVASLDEVGALYARLRRDAPAGVIDLVPAARTVLVVFDPATVNVDHLRILLAATPTRADAARGAEADPADLRPGAGDAGRGGPAAGPDAVVEVPVHYDGPDLAEVAALTGLTPAQVVERHARGGHRVAFCGFAPGFAYVTGLDPALHVARRDSPRTRVPPGAVAIAGGFSGVYPRASPGGWRLIGHTDLRVFDLDREPPALLAPGARVRFVDVDRTAS